MTPSVQRLATCHGLLLDMDGTLVNSNSSVERAWSAWAVSVGADPDEVVAFCHGQPVGNTLRRFAPDMTDEEVDRAAQVQIEREIRDVDGVRAMSGAHELIEWMNERLPWAMVTNSPAALAQARLAAAGIAPPVLVTMSDVENPKPHPEPFLRGAELLGLEPGSLIAVEDSGAGLTSAREAGCLTVGVAGATDADIVCRDLADLLALLREAHPA